MDDLQDVEVVLLDIEGTVCPISFVKDILFPYALQVLPSVLDTQWDDPNFTPYRDAFPAQHRTTPQALLAHVQDLMFQDVKIAYLKSLQGYLWTQGYETGSLRCPLFGDVAPALRAWHATGLTIIIYSSGSVPAQKLLFQYTDADPTPDLRPLIADYFDTVNAGSKTVRTSYETIAGTRPGVLPAKWLFLSDNAKEVRAATEAGMKAFVVVRPGNARLTPAEREGNVLVESFEEVKLRK